MGTSPSKQADTSGAGHDATIGGEPPPGTGAPPVFERTRPESESLRADAFAEIVRQSGLTPAALALNYAKLAFGPGSLAISDFIRLRLFDPEIRAAAKLESFVGQRRNRDLCVAANFRHDWLGLMSDKIAGRSYLAAHGFPTIPIAAIYAPRLSGVAAGVLTERADLEAFLLDPARYPLFGKPVEGFQSLGSIALSGCRPGARMLERPDGTVVTLESVVEAIHASYHEGYVFQPLAAPDPEIGALCGLRLATVRLITVAQASGPRVFRAAWKLPAGAHMADNYWRSGNLLGQIDLASGRLGRVVSGTGLALREHALHPDTGTPLAGFQHPHWAAMCALALEGARLMRHVPLVGWDIACTAQGPVVVEMNEAPDFFLVQLADRTGVLGPDFDAFLAEQRERASEHHRVMKRTIAKL